MADLGRAQEKQQTDSWQFDATSLILDAISPLCAHGLSPKKARYFEEKVHRFLTCVVELLLEQQSEQPELAVLLWLLRVFSVPDHLSSQVHIWASERDVLAGKAAPGVSTATTLRSKRRLSTASNDSLNGFGEEGKAGSEEKAKEDSSETFRPGRLTAPVEGKAKDSPEIHRPGRKTAPAEGKAKDIPVIHRMGRMTTALPVAELLVEAEDRGRKSGASEPADRLELLRNLSLFEKLEDSTMQEMAKEFKITKFLEGEDIMRIGERSEGLHIVLAGQGKVSVVAESGNYRQGDVFGFRQLLDGDPSCETVEAWGGPLTTLYLPASAFFSMGLPRQLRSGMRRRSARAAARRGEGLADLHPPSITHSMSFGSFGSGHARERACSRIPLHETDLQLIQGAIQANPNLGELLNLTERQLERICQVARLAFFVEGQAVFQRGSQGDTFYVVQEGIFQITDGDSCGGANDRAITLRAGDSFGELALLYDTSRTATVTCIRNGSLWSISRAALRSVLKLSVDGRIQEYRSLIRGVQGLAWLNEDDQAVICEALEEMCFIKGECVVNQGMEADAFYIVLDGTCVVMADGESKRTLGKGDSFGERALLTNDVRSATVEVTSDACTVLILDRDVFKLLWDQPHCPEAAAAGFSPKPPPGPSPSSASGGVEHHGRSRARREMERRVMKRLKDNPQSRASVLGQPGAEKIPRSRLDHRGVLGRGSYGFVSLECDTATGKLYALKAMSKSHITRERLKEAVLNEKACMQLLDSDFVVRLYGAYQDALHIYLLLEVCYGGELFDIYDKNADLFGVHSHARFFAACVALALEHMHDRRIVYRDLKLENCLLTGSGYVKLTDMGLAKVLVGKTYTICGTTDYFAPETLRQTGHNRAVDWWALGIMIYIMMSGRAPFDAPDAMSTYKKIIKGFSKVSFPESMPPACVNLVLGLCKKKPEERLTMGSMGVQNLKDQPWYHDFDWRKLQDQSMPSPIGFITTEEQFLATAKTTSVEPLCQDECSDDEIGWPDFVSY